MKKLLLLLLLIPNLVMGEWVGFDIGIDGQFFLKRNSAEHINGKIRFEQYWNINNRSVLLYSEINCNERSVTDLNTVWYSDENLKGEVIEREGRGDKFYPPPNTTEGSIVRTICPNVNK